MFRRSLFPFAASVLASPLAFAWPDQPIKIVVPFTPGTGPDIVGRFLSERYSAALGQNAVVENVAGASGNIGTQQVARAKPDGYTLMSQVSTLVMNASLFANLPYDPVADFAPVGMTAWGSLVLVANPAQKPNTLAEFIAAAKAAPKSIFCRPALLRFCLWQITAFRWSGPSAKSVCHHFLRKTMRHSWKKSKNAQG